MIKYVVIDSNIICADFQMTGSSFRVFFDGLKRNEIELYVPEIVIDEVKSKYTEELQKCKSKTEQIALDIKRLTGKPISFSTISDFIQKAIDEYSRMLERQFTNVGAFIIDYPKVSHKTLVQRALSRRKPFTKAGDGYRDALIWETVVEIARIGRDPLVFITKNHKDFGDDNSRLHPDLIGDLQERGLRPESVVLYESLEKFVDDKIKPTLEILKDVHSQIADGKYPLLDLREELSDRLSDALYGTEVKPAEIGFPPEFENPTIDLVYEPSDIKVGSVRRLSSDELLIETELNVECEFDFFIFKPDFYVMSEERRPYVSNYDWNEHVVAASKTTEVHVVLQLTFDTNSRKVTSIEIESIGESGELKDRDDDMNQMSKKT